MSPDELAQLLRRPDWWDHINCRGQTELMYDLDRTTEAKALCRGCQVRARCLAEALARNEPDGIWGGYTTKERNERLTMSHRRSSRPRP